MLENGLIDLRKPWPFCAYAQDGLACAMWKTFGQLLDSAGKFITVNKQCITWRNIPAEVNTYHCYASEVISALVVELNTC